MGGVRYGVFIIVSIITACNQGEPSRPEVSQPLCSDLSPSVSVRRVRRLADREVDAVIGDLLEEPSSAFSGIVPDPRVEGYDTDARGLIVSSPKLDAWLTAADEVEPRLVAKIACSPREVGHDCTGRFVDAFA